MAPARPVVEVLSGIEVVDPYRWLEDGDSPETVTWVEAQNDRTRSLLHSLPARPRIHQRMVELLSVGMVGAPQVAGNLVFTLEREGGADQARLMVRSATDHLVEARMVVDAHGLAADHAASIDWFSPSPDGRLVAYGVSQGGSEHGSLAVVDVGTGQHLDDRIDNVRHPSMAWLPDGSAFAYSRLPDAGSVPPGDEGYWERVLWHRLGDDPAGDEVVWEGPDKTALPAATISPDGRWLVVHVSFMPTRTDVILVDRQTSRRQVVVEGEEASTWCQVVDGRLYAVTNLGSPRGRVVVVDVADPRPGRWRTLVAESDVVVEAAVVAGDHLVVASTRRAVSQLHRYGLDGGGASEVVLPEHGSISGLDADPAHERAFLTFTSFARPPGLWRWTPETPLAEWSSYPLPTDPGAFEVEQVLFPSTDGMPVPMFLVRAAQPQGSRREPAQAPRPTVLTGYGGFAISSSPAFSPGVVAFCEAGGLYALAGIRGGGEEGEDWHRAGMRHRKQQCFDDFYAAADWLVEQGYTQRDHLAIRGGSNGGLLVGAAVTQRPDLCRAAVCSVPLLDMVRYHRFLIGALWVPEYGDPDDPDDLRVLLAYSPYHHVPDGGPFPALLVTTAESDSRVDPMHARKFVARAQARRSDPGTEGRPVLLRVGGRAGHGVGKPAWKQADELADTWAFLHWQLGMD